MSRLDKTLSMISLDFQGNIIQAIANNSSAIRKIVRLQKYCGGGGGGGGGGGRRKEEGRLGYVRYGLVVRGKEQEEEGREREGREGKEEE